jgi:hypothetical protein
MQKLENLAPLCGVFWENDITSAADMGSSSNQGREAIQRKVYIIENVSFDETDGLVKWSVQFCYLQGPSGLMVRTTWET